MPRADSSRSFRLPSHLLFLLPPSSSSFDLYFFFVLLLLESSSPSRLFHFFLLLIPELLDLSGKNSSKLSKNKKTKRKKTQNQLPHRLLRHTANTGPAAARNTGLDAAAAAGGSLVAFTDADCAPASTWLETIVKEQQEVKKRGVVCGRTEADGAWAEALAAAAAAELPAPPPLPTTTKHKPSLIDEFHDRSGTLNGRFLPDGSLLYGCTCNLSLALRPTPTTTTTKAPSNGDAAAPSASADFATAAAPPLHFDPEFREAAFEDVDFSVRARELGLPLSYCERALVHHDFSSRSAALGLFRQFERYGFWEPLMTRKHPRYFAWFGSSTAIPSSLASEAGAEAEFQGAAAAASPAAAPAPSSAATTAAQ